MKPTGLTETKYHKNYTLLPMKQTPVQRAEITTSKRMFSSIAILFLFLMCGCNSLVVADDGQDSAEEQYHLGNRYFTGQGVKQDYREAVYWYTKAAEQGFSEVLLKVS